jgi:hypothetical protein
MDDPRLKRPLLESLSTGELIRLADSYGIEIPPGLERVFIVRELLDIALDAEPDSEEEWEANQNAIHDDLTETAALPKQYNITFIEVMVRDPLWAFVFWEIKKSDKELFEKESDFKGYCLRVIPLESAGQGETEQPFMVPVGIDDTAWYLGFPPAEGSYRVELCVLQNEKETVLAGSRPFRLPRFLDPPAVKNSTDTNDEIQAIYQNPLVILSGAADFQVIRSAERQCRFSRNNGLRSG